MKNLTLTKRLFWLIALFICLTMAVLVGYLYRQANDLTQTRAYSKAKTLHDYFISMRYIYQQQFLQSGIDLNDSTVGFLPAHASTHISDYFKDISEQHITIRNVSDRPRNKDNQADPLEEKMLHYFEKHPDENESLQLIHDPKGDYYLFSSPLRIQPFCLACHGKKEEVLPYIAQRYTSAFGYKVGDVRGLTSIKIPRESIHGDVMAFFWEETIFSLVITVFLLILMYIAIKELTKRDVEQKKELTHLVQEKTESLEQKSMELTQAYARQKHLYSVLRTIASSNQILITAYTLNELLDETAKCLFENDSFANVRILLWENGILNVRTSLGVKLEDEIDRIEQLVFEQNKHHILTQHDAELPTHRQELLRYQLSEVYCTPLKSDKYAHNVLGVLTLCTMLPSGFSQEEQAMIEELAGNIGFAINSFRQKESILKLSYYDYLTDLANKTMLTEQIRLCINACKRTHLYGALLFMDVDHFKSINDLKGHATGDKLLVMMARRLESFIEENDIVARFGGDEFAFARPNISLEIQEAAKVAESLAVSLLTAAKEPFMIDGHSFFVTLSIGIGIFGEDENVETLLSHADSAMYAAKNDGRDTIRFFDSTIQQIMEEKSLLLQQLRDAIDSEHFMLLYQPQVNETGEIIGVEALVRLYTRNKEMLSPARFIPLCEESGLILPLGKWVLQEAMRQVKRWQDNAQKSHWRVSVNVIMKQFERDDFVALVSESLKETNIDASLVRLELTESLLIGDSQKAFMKIDALKALGVSLSIDDFGTGYSNLQYLKSLNVNELKIDQSFIRDFVEDKNDAMIVETVLSIGQKFHLEVIAEGVETREQFEALKALGCRFFQGYFFGKPSDPDAL